MEVNVHVMSEQFSDLSSRLSDLALPMSQDREPCRDGGQKSPLTRLEAMKEDHSQPPSPLDLKISCWELTPETSHHRGGEGQSHEVSPSNQDVKE